jgi:hypothetical protein
VWEGTVVSLHIAPRAAAPMQSVAEVRAVPGRGLEGDRYFIGTGFYSTKPSHGGREVTLIEIEAVEAPLRWGYQRRRREARGRAFGARCPAQCRDRGRSAESSGRPRVFSWSGSYAWNTSLRALQAFGRAHGTWRTAGLDPSRRATSPYSGRGHYPRRRCYP